MRSSQTFLHTFVAFLSYFLSYHFIFSFLFPSYRPLLFSSFIFYLLPLFPVSLFSLIFFHFYFMFHLPMYPFLCIKLFPFFFLLIIFFHSCLIAFLFLFEVRTQRLVRKSSKIHKRNNIQIKFLYLFCRRISIEGTIPRIRITEILYAMNPAIEISIFRKVLVQRRLLYYCMFNSSCTYPYLSFGWK